MPDEREATVPPDKVTVFRRALLRWYRSNGRRFPWRETDDPYLILLSEVLLQRTQASQVEGSYERIVTGFPTPQALADATEGAIQAALWPLGLRKRATTLKRMGEELVDRFDGRVSTDIAELTKLPGVGRYVAAATASFAAGRHVAVLDANVIRIFSRYYGIVSERKRPREDADLWHLADSLLPRKGTKDYNRALIDFAALVCKPRAPTCQECPLRRRCRAAPELIASLARPST